MDAMHGLSRRAVMMSSLKGRMTLAAEARPPDWAVVLSSVHGLVRDGLETIPSSRCLDAVGAPPRRGQFSRLDKVMTELGWTACRIPDSRAGRRCRGYRRPEVHADLPPLDAELVEQNPELREAFVRLQAAIAAIRRPVS
jgi:hypothetical protein